MVTKSVKSGLRVSVTLEDTEGKTKERFEVNPDEAFAIQTLLHCLRGTKPKVKASWIEACKAALLT